MCIKKLYDPNNNKYCLVLQVGWRALKFTGFWFGKKL